MILEKDITALTSADSVSKKMLVKYFELVKHNLITRNMLNLSTIKSTVPNAQCMSTWAPAF